MKNFVKLSVWQVVCLLCLLSLSGCSDDNGGPTKPSGPNLAAERQAIVNTYRAWTLALQVQSYDSALSFTVPNGNAYNFTKNAKIQWDDGWQFYFELRYIEAWLDLDSFERGYGEAVGNLKFYQYKPSVGETTYYMGFYSSCRKSNGTWKIDGINTNLDEDWWR